MDEVTVVVNPVSGKGAGQRVGEQVVESLRARKKRAVLVPTRGPGDETRVISEGLAQGQGVFIVCGGDGTLGEAANALAGSGAVLGVVPCGRGNDFARALGISRRVEDAIAVLLDGEAQPMDLGRIGGRYFCTVACGGVDGEAGRLVYEGRTPVSGRAAFVWALARTLATFRGTHTRVSGEFGCFEGHTLLTAVGNTGIYGGGVRILPHAVRDDGLLDVCVIRAVPWPKWPELYFRAFGGRHLSLPYVCSGRSREVYVESQPPLWMIADGEPVCRTPARIEAAPGALTVLLPRRGPGR